MKNRHTATSPLTFVALPLLCLAMALSAQAQPAAPNTASTDDEQAETIQRPNQSDKTSQTLINNSLAASGGKAAYTNLVNLTATGTRVEAGLVKSFELIETLDGKRQLTYHWKHLGRSYQIRQSFDGSQSWKQELLPKKKPPTPVTGRKAVHFARQRWLLQPFIEPLSADYVFQYQGSSKVSGRAAYIVKGYGKKNEPTWFYFDKERSLLTRWGGTGVLANTELYIDYQATEFASTNGVLLPKKIDQLAMDAKFATITFDSITANQAIDPKCFELPVIQSPVLRQKSASQSAP
jgi:hypothetical protein